MRFYQKEWNWCYWKGVWIQLDAICLDDPLFCAD